MSVKTEEIVRALKDLTVQNENVITAIVEDVDVSAKTISAKSDGIIYYDVRLTAVNDDSDRSYVVPKKGSWVLISFVEGSDTDAFVVMFSSVEKYLINATEIVINDGKNGGLIKISVLVEKMNNLEKAYNDFVKKYNAHVHITTATIGPTAVPGIIAPTTSLESTVIIKTKVKDVENEKILH